MFVYVGRATLVTLLLQQGHLAVAKLSSRYIINCSSSAYSDM